MKRASFTTRKFTSGLRLAFWLFTSIVTLFSPAPSQAAGTLKVFGGNESGQLGLGHKGALYTPTQVNTNVKAVASGASHVLILKNDGTLWTAGFNGYGELGDGTFKSSLVPLQIATSVAKVAASDYASYFIKTDGTLWSFGYNAYGQLGNGTSTDSSSPVQIASGVKEVAASGQSVIFVKTNGSIWTAGYNGWGNLGDGSTVSTPTPMQIGVGGVGVAAGEYSNYFLKTDGTVWAMGYNGYGNFGNGTTDGSTAPVQVYSGVSQVAARNSRTFFLKTDGTLWAAGSAGYELGDPYQNHYTPYQLDTAVAHVELGTYATYYTKTDGTFWALGLNNYGELCDGTTTPTPTPIQVSTSVSFATGGLSSGYFVKTDGSLWVAGYDNYGQLGDGVGSLVASPTTLMTGVLSAVGGERHSLVLKADGTVSVMGYNLYGQLGLGDTTDRVTHTVLAGLNNVKSVYAGRYSSFFLKGDGTLWGAGNYSNSFGDGITGDYVPAQFDDHVASLSLGYYHSLTVKTDSTLHAAGPNYYGQLGDGTVSSNAVNVTVATGVVDASAGLYHSVFIKSDGSLWAMGNNGYGQFADGTINNHFEPEQVATNVIAAAAGPSFTLFLKADGTLWAAGSGSYGELGASNYIGSTPSQIADHVAAFDIGYDISSGNHTTTVYLKTDGTAWSMGSNARGQAGNGTFLQAVATEPIATGVVNLGMGYNHGFVITGASPAVVYQPKSMAVADGGAALLSVTAVGTGLSFQWERGTRAYAPGHAFPEPSNYTETWAPIGSATANTYSIPVFHAAQQGDYRCVVTSGVTHVPSDIAVLTLAASAPVITTPPASLTVTEDDPASFTVVATGTGLSYQWYRSVHATNELLEAISGATSSTYTPPSTHYSDEGYYTVRVSGGGGIAEATANLNITLHPPVINSQPVSLTTNDNTYAYFSVSASGANLAYQWFRGTPGGTHTLVSNLSYLQFLAHPDVVGSYYVVVSNNGGSVTSDVVTLTVQTPPVVTVNPASISSVDANATVTFTVDAAGDPTPTVQWQVSTNEGSTWSDISGATDKTYSFVAALADDNHYFRAVFTNAFGSVESSPAALFINQAPVFLVEPTDQTATVGSYAYFRCQVQGRPLYDFTVEASTDNGATYATISKGYPYYFYTWYSGVNSLFVDVYLYPQIGDNGKLFRIIFSNSLGTATSRAFRLTVPSAPVIATQPLSLSVNPNTTATFTAAATGTPTPTAQWQFSSDGGSTFTDIPGATSSTLSFTALPSMNGRLYKAIYTNTYGSTETSLASLTVNAAPVITTQPIDKWVAPGSTVTFNAAATGVPTPTVQWQVSANGGLTFTDISGATTVPLSLVANAALSGNKYRALFTNAVDSTATNAATLTVNSAPAITTQPGDLTVTNGNTASFTVAASGYPVPTVQWQVSTNGGVSYAAISGATSLTLSFTAAAADQGKKYRAVFTNSEGSTFTNGATLTVNTSPSVTTSPASQSLAAGSTVTFTASANGTPTPSVQWQVSSDGGTTFTNVPGATSTTLSFAVSLAEQAKRYRAVFTNSVGSATTTAATLTITAAPAISTNPSDLGVTAGASATFTASATGAPTPTVQWQVSSDGGATYSNIPGATSSSLNFSTTSGDNGKRYRAVYTNASGSATSTPATLTVTAAASVQTNPVNVTTPTGSTATFSASATGTPTPTVQWQVSLDGVTFTNIPGATSTTLSFAAAVADSGNLYRAVFTNSTGSATTTAASLTVTAAAAVQTNPANVTTTAGSTATFSASATGTPTPTIQWQVSLDGVTFTNIPGATSTTLSFAAAVADSGKLYRAVFTNSTGSATTTAASLTVTAAAAVQTNPANVTTTAGSTATFSASATGTPTPTVQWQVSADGVTFTNIPGATSTTLSFAAAVTDSGKLYRAVFTNSTGSATTTAASLTVTAAAAVQSNPANVTTAAGSTATFTASATGTPTPTVQWQVSTDGVTFTNIPGATSTTLSFAAAVADSGKSYRAVFTNSTGSATTTAASLTVTAAAAVQTNPANVTTTAGSTATFSASATGTPTPTVQWQVSLDGVTFTNIPGATSTTLSFAAAVTDSGKLYRAVFTNSTGSATTTAASLTVTAAAAVQSNPANLTTAAGSTATFSASATGTPTPTVQWQVSTDGVTFTNIPGATSTTLSFAAAVTDSGKLYRAVFTNSTGSATTTAASLTVTATAAVQTNPANVTTTAGSTATFSASATGTPTPTIQWQVSLDGVTFTNIPGATSTTLSFAAAVADSGKIYRAVFTNSTGSATTTAASLTVTAAAAVQTNPPNVTTTAGSTATFSASATGTPTPTVQWQVSADGVTFTNIPGATSTTLSFAAAVADSGKYYRAVFTNSTGSATTTAASLTVTAAAAVQSNPANVTTTAGSTATFSASATGTPAPTVQWQVSLDGVTFTNISGATSTTLSFAAAVADSGKYYRAVFTNSTGSATTTAASLTVTAAAAVQTNPANVTTTAGSTATFSASATGTPTPTVQWQASLDGVTFTNIPGATSTTLSFAAAVADSGKYYRAVFTNSTGSATTTAASLTVTAAAAVQTNPANVTTTAGSTATFSASATGTPTPTVQWQVSLDGVTFTNIPGATSTTLSFAAAVADSGKLYRAVFTNSTGSATTTAASLTVTAAAAVQTNPANVTTTAGSTATFSASATGTPTPTVQWQVSLDGVTFTNIPGATSTTLSFAAAVADSGKLYRAVFTNSTGSATTTAASLTVTAAAAVQTNPANVTTTAGSTATFTASATGTPAPTVQWQVSLDGVTFTNIPGATSTTLSFAAAVADSGKLYRAIFTNSTGSAMTTAASLMVTAAAAVQTNPANVTTTASSTATFSASATGTPTPTVQWQVSLDGVTFTNIPGATSTTLSFAAAVADSGKLYRAVFTNSTGSATTTAASLTVTAAAAVQTNPANVTTTAGSTATFSASATGTPTPTVQWQVSLDGVTFTNIPGATSTTLSFAAAVADSGKLYRAVFTNSTGSATTTAASLTVTAATAVQTNPANVTTTAGSTATFSASATGTPTPTVQWQVSADGVTFTNIPGATSTTLSFAATVTDSGKLYRAVFTNSTGSATTTAASLTVTAAAAVQTNPANVTTTAGSTAIFSASATGTPTPTVQWQVSTDVVTFTNIPGATSTTLSFAAAVADSGKYYRAVFTNSTGSATTTAASLTVTAAAAVQTNPANVTTTAGSTATFSASATGTPTPTVQWQVSLDGVTFTNIPGATSTTLSFAATVTDSGKLYRAVFTNSTGSATTTAASLTVTAAAAVQTNPANVTTTAGSTATFSASATGTPTPTVQWQVSTNNGVTFANVPGASSLTLSLTTVLADNGKQFRAVFTNGVGTATTTAAKLAVNPVVVAPAISANPANKSASAGTSVSFTASATGTPTPTVQWQVSSDNGTTFSNLSGATSATLSFTATSADSGKRYRAVFTNSAGNATTSAATLTVTASLSVTADPVNASVATGAKATFTANAAGTPAPTVQWQVSTNGGASFTNIPGATSTTLSFTTTAADNGKRYRAVFTNSSGTATSRTATLSVNAGIVITLNPTDVTYSGRTTVTFEAAASGSPTPWVQWQVSTDGGETFTNLRWARSTTLELHVDRRDAGNLYRAVFRNATGRVYTTAAKLIFTQGLYITYQPDDQWVADGEDVTFFARARGVGRPAVQWQVSTDGGATFANIPGANRFSLHFTMTEPLSGNLYRAVFTEGSNTVTSDAATLYLDNCHFDDDDGDGDGDGGGGSR